MKTVELITKIIGAFAALLGLAGYVLILGATILWIRLHEAKLPTALPISLAPKGELIAIGAQAVAVWAILMIVLLAVGAWIVTGDSERRRFGYVEAGLALTTTLTTLPVLQSGATGLIVFVGIAALIVVGTALLAWPSGEEMAALLLPVATGAALAAALSAMSNIDRTASMVGAVFVFGALVFLTPLLQKWRKQQEANLKGAAAVKAVKPASAAKPDSGDPLLAALERNGPHGKPAAILWIERVAVALVVLLAVGTIAVASQIKRDKNFNHALVSLTNGDCVTGTYVTRSSEQVVLAQPKTTSDDSDALAHVTTIPTKEVLALHVYGSDEEGEGLADDEKCAANEEAALVHPAADADELIASAVTPMDDSATHLLRTGRLADVEAVLDFWQRAEASPVSTESAADVEGLLERDPEALLIAEADGAIVGTLVVGWDGWRATFYRLAVDPAHRRHGLGSKLVRAGEDRVRALGAKRLNAITESHKPAAMGFWAAAGYELQTSRSRFVKNLP
jgi:ribosomal protein S18 acetylase RimI-like enzyme